VEAYSIPPDSQLGQVAVVGVAAPLSPRTPYPALALGFRWRSSHVIANPSVCLLSIVCHLWRCCTLLRGL